VKRGNKTVHPRQGERKADMIVKMRIVQSRGGESGSEKLQIGMLTGYEEERGGGEVQERSKRSESFQRGGGLRRPHLQKKWATGENPGGFLTRCMPRSKSQNWKATPRGHGGGRRTGEKRREMVKKGCCRTGGGEEANGRKSCKSLPIKKERGRGNIQGEKGDDRIKYVTFAL